MPHPSPQLEEKYRAFQHEQSRKRSREKGVPIDVVSGKYNGKSGLLLDRSGRIMEVEIEMEPGKWHQTRLPTTSMRIKK